METVEIVEMEELEPVYFVPKRVSLIADTAMVLSWVMLVGFLGQVVVQAINLNAQIVSQSLVFGTLIKEPSFLVYLFVNLLTPLLTGLFFFAVLQAASMGLNMLLENDFNVREVKGKG